jgi:hypothetical protein
LTIEGKGSKTTTRMTGILLFKNRHNITVISRGEKSQLKKANVI